MSIIIPGVELPPIDEYLHLRIDGNGYVSMQISENQYICDLYDTDKKAIELPPHGRLGDLDALGKVISEGLAPSVKAGGFKHPFDIIRAVANAPTIIPADREEDT